MSNEENSRLHKMQREANFRPNFIGVNFHSRSEEQKSFFGTRIKYSRVECREGGNLI